MSWDKKPPTKVEIERVASTGWDAEPPPKQNSRPGDSVVAVRNLAQGLSGNISDEVAGGVEAIGEALGFEGAGGPMKDIKRSGRGLTTDWDVIKDAYIRGRDRERAALKDDQKYSPEVATVANLTGAVLSPVNKLAKGASLARGGAKIGAVTAAGTSEADNVADMVEDVGVGAGMGAAVGKAADKAAPYVQKGAKKVGEALGRKAEKLAVNATGATGVQASKFESDAGRQLLDRKLVRFGDTAEKVAERTGRAVDEASAQIDDALKALDAEGVTANQDNIIAKLNQKIDDLRSDPSQASVARKLEQVVEDIKAASKVNGSPKVTLSKGEQIKRGYRKASGNWMDPDAGQAGKQAYLGYMDEVERAAEANNPALAAKFKEGKETYKLLAPIEEAASRRAATTNQSPFGGVGDMFAAAAGAAGGPGTTVATVAAKKTLFPRVTSSAAVTFDKVSRALKGMPQMQGLAKKSPALYNAITSKFNGAESAAADNDQGPKLKGEDKWVVDGFEKIEKHGVDGFDPETIAEMAQSRVGRKLLVSASDLKPGSKAMDRVVDQINEKFKKGGR